MTWFRKFTDYLWMHQWIIAAFMYVIMYVAMCVWMYMTATVEVQGIALPQHDAGIIALAVWHGILLFAFGAGWGLHKLVDWISKIRNINKN